MKKLLPLLLVILFFTPSSWAQSSASWNWGKADVADISTGNLAYNQHTAAASGSKVLWAMLQNYGMNYSSFYFGNYKLTEYDNSGSPGSSTTITGKLYLKAAQADAAGNWYVLGQFYDTVTFPGGPTFINLATSSTTPNFIFKLNSGSLTVAWAKVISAEASATAFTITNNGLYMSIDSSWTYISKFDLNTGDRTDLFMQPFTSSTSSIAVDSTGNIYLAGSCAFSGINFNGHIVTTSITYPVYIVKYTADGTYGWHHLLADVTCTERKLTLANDNTLYYSGKVNDTLTLGSFSVHHPRWVYDYLVSRLDSSGNVLWVKQQKDSLEGDADLENLNHAVAMADGSLSVFATLRGYIDWGNSLITDYGINSNVAIVNYSANGVVNWVKPVNALQSNARNIAGNGTDIWVTGNIYDSTAYHLDATTVPVVPITITPFLAKLHTAPGTAGVAATTPYDNCVEVMPVPATNSITIKMPPDATGSVAIRLTDVSGRMVLNKTTDGSMSIQRLEVGQYSRGVYFMDISGDGFRTVRKVVLQ